MGSFYTSHTLHGASHAAVKRVLQGRSAFVSTPGGPVVVVLDEACEAQEGEVLAALGAKLSKELQCPVLALLNHDDDILYFELYERGKKTDEYNSSPSYFAEAPSEEDGPSGGDAKRLAAAFGAHDAGAIESVLRSQEYVFATDRHRDLAAALGIPEFAVGIGYTYAEANDFPLEWPVGTYAPA